MLKRGAIVTGDQLVDASQGFSEGSPAVFVRLDSRGADEMLRTFNCGIGMVVCVAEAQAAQARELLEAAGETVLELGAQIFDRRHDDALPNIDFIMSFAHPHELEPDTAYLESFRCMAANSIKPIVNTAKDRTDLEKIWEIGTIFRGSEAAHTKMPYTIHYAEPISPLKHPHSSVDRLMFCAEKGMPAIYSPAPIAGSTAPMTIAGHVVQGLAESLFGLVIHQLTKAGAPFLVGIGTAVLDMSTSQCSYNAPEYLMAYMAMVEMSHFLNLPNWGYAGTSDSQLPDGQATFEAGLMTYMSMIAGSNLNHDIGYLDFGLTGSLEMIVIMDEVVDQLRRMQQGIPVNDETLAVEVIAEGGKQGEFLSHPHTLKHLFGLPTVS